MSQLHYELSLFRSSVVINDESEENGTEAELDESRKIDCENVSADVTGKECLFISISVTKREEYSFIVIFCGFSFCNLTFRGMMTRFKFQSIL